VNAQGAVRPVLTGPVILADGNTLDFLRIVGTNGDAIDGDGQNGGTITNCEITDILRPGPGTGGALSAEQSFGFWTVSNNVIDNAAGAAIDFGAVDNDSLTAVINDNTITDSGFNAIAFVTEGASQVLAQINGNDLSGNGTNATVEIIVGDSSTFGLDLEDNTNDDVYSFTAIAGPALFEIEQLSTLTQSKPGGAGNTGTVDITSGGGSEPPVEVANGTFNFNN
jgi:hypothetical protein